MAAVKTAQSKPISSTVSKASPVSVHLDAVRGIAAIAVMLSHLRYLFFMDYEELPHKSPLLKLFYFLTGLGHPAVIIFFILSGYLIKSSVFRASDKNAWSWHQYGMARLTRLYVVLIPALLLAAFWDHLGLHLFADAPIYAGTSKYPVMFPKPIAQLATFPNWLGNLFFLQEIRVPAYGSNGPMWSLSYEAWYYALFPLLLFGLSRSTTARARIGYLIGACLILVMVGKTIDLYFIIWLMGAAISESRILPGFRHLGVKASVFVAFLSALFIARFHLIKLSEAIDFLTAITFAMVLLVIVNTNPAAVLHKGYIKAARFFSGISFTLYLVHVPFLVFINSLIIRNQSRWLPDAKHFLMGTILTAIVVGYAVIIWRIAEANTNSVRQSLQRWDIAGMSRSVRFHANK